MFRLENKNGIIYNQIYILRKYYIFVEGCKSWEDIREAEKNTLNDWIAHYFITPIVPTCVYLLASIATLNAFPIITFLVAEMKNNEKNTMKD